MVNAPFDLAVRNPASDALEALAECGRETPKSPAVTEHPESGGISSGVAAWHAAADPRKGRSAFAPIQTACRDAVAKSAEFVTGSLP